MPHCRRFGVTRVTEITGLDVVGIPVATAYRPNARSLSVAQGKGTSADAARASALMEAIEFAHAEQHHLPLRLARRDEFDGSSQYVDPDALAHGQASALGDDQPLLWIEGRSLVDARPSWVPHDAVHLDLTLPLGFGVAFLRRSSNGLASGNTLAEAVVHALCEVIERDAARLWELAGPMHQIATRLDLTTVTEVGCRQLLECYERAGIEVAAYDLTSDLGVPVVLAHIADAFPDPFRLLAPAAGAGCHLHPTTALRRALTEAAQTRLIDIAGVRDDLPRTDDDAMAERHDDEPDRLPPLPSCALPFPNGEGIATDSILGDAANVIGRLQAAGLDAVLVDLTQPALGVPVARVVVAGLEGLPQMMTGDQDEPGVRGLRAAGAAR